MTPAVRLSSRSRSAGNGYSVMGRSSPNAKTALAALLHHLLQHAGDNA